MRMHPLEMVLSTVTYKPGWSFEVQVSRERHGCADPLDRAHLMTCIRTIESRTGEPALIAHRTMMPPDRVVGDWLSWLRDEVRRIEQHESDEFFRVAGQMLRDPHRHD